MRPYAVRAAAVLLVTAVTMACDDVPLLPQWDADIYVPAGTASLKAGDPSFPTGTIPPSTSSPTINGPYRSASMAGTTGDLLNEIIDSLATNLRIEVRMRKSANLAASLADTILLASDSAGLATTNIQNGIAMAVGDTFVVDTIQMGPAQVNLIRSLVLSDGTLWMRTRGRVTTGANAVTIQPTDSIQVRIGLLAKVPVAGGK